MSKLPKIGSASIDENGRARGGKAGNQSGSELRIQDWYKHSKGWIVLRAKDPRVAEKIAYAMKAAIENKHIGYDQDQRNTLYNAAKDVGFDPAKVTTNVETDCSALVRVCLAYAGIIVSNFNTSTEVSRIMATGKFMELTDSQHTNNGDYLRIGDILVTKTQGHTVVVLTNGIFGADDAVPTPVPEPVEPGAEYPYNTKTTGSYWLRTKPSTLGAKIKGLPAGTVVRVYGEINGWYGVKEVSSGLKGYISHKAFM